LHLVVDYLGENTNNVVELLSLIKGLKVAINNHYQKVIVEGDSQIIIQLITKILHGDHPLKISPSWRLSGLLEDFGDLIHPSLTIIPSHVKRDTNKVADCLANEGVDTKLELIHWQANSSECTDLSKQCQDLASKDVPAPDGVTHCKSQTPGTTHSLTLNEVGRSPSLQH
jgi:ribonuclease HI